MKKLLFFMVINIFVALTITCALVYAEDQEKILHYYPGPDGENPKMEPLLKERLIAGGLRESVFNSSDIINILKITPEMTIVDIGAGYGFFTFPLAEKLNDTGKVYATEISPERANFLTQEAAKKGLKNVEVKKVTSEGVDPFYKNNSFDLIFLSDTYYQLFSPMKYFRELIPRLKKNGRICILQPKFNQKFNSYIDVEDNNYFKYLISFFRGKGENFPIFKRLRPETKNFILTWESDGKTAIPMTFRKNLIEELNNMLNDKKLIFDMMDFYTPPNVILKFSGIEYNFPDNYRLINFLTVELMGSNAFEKKAPLTDEEQEFLTKLNTLLIQESFDIKNVLQWVMDPWRNLIVSERGIIKNLSSLGLTLLEEHELPHHTMLIFGKN